MSFFRSLLVIIRKNKLLAENFSYLSLLQGFNVILPLVIYPYLIRILGTEIYGLVVFAQAIIGYLVILVNFGFNITATKEVSLHREEPAKLNEIVSSIFLLKFIFLLISFLLLYIILNVLLVPREYYLLFYFTMWMCVQELIFPVFYFQGLEKMRYITFFTVASRLLFVGLIFVFINNADDYLKVPLINGIGAIVAGGGAVLIMLRDGIRFKFPPFLTVVPYVKNSYVMALSYASNSFKSNFNLVGVKMLFSFTEVAYFDLALKIVNMGITFLDLISVTIFPKMSREKNSIFLKKVIRGAVFISIIYVLAVQLFAPLVVGVLGGEEMVRSVAILRFLVFIVPIYIIGALLGRNCLIVHGFDKDVLKSMVYSGVFYLIIFGVLYFLNLNHLLLFAFMILSSYLLETIYRYQKCKTRNLI